MTTVEKEVTTTTEIKISRSTEPTKRAMYTTAMPEYKSSYTTESIGGFYGPGSRPAKIVPERRSLSGSSAALTIRDSREREKKEISDLNDRLASYIEKVRFLDAQNRKMASDLELFRARMGKDTMSTRSMYEGEIAEAHKLINESNAEREDLEKQIRKIQAEIADFQKKYNDAVRGHELDRRLIDDLIVTFTGVENEANLLRRRIAESESEVGALKKTNHEYIALQGRLHADTDYESLSRIDYQNKVQMLLEEIEFSRREQEQELNDLHSIAARDTTLENREYFKSELASAIKAIRIEYDQLMANSRQDIESWYNLKVQEIHTTSNRRSLEQGYAKEEVKRLRTQLSDLRTRLANFEGRNSLLEKQIIDLNYQLEEEQRVYEFTLKERDSSIFKIREECEALVVELQRLLDTKATLEAEIITYRRLLEGEESRAGLRRLVQTISKTEQEKIELERLSKDGGEITSKISFQGSAKGNISIQDAAVNGKYITLENTHLTKEEAIGEWKISRSVDNGPDVVYTLPKNFELKPMKTVKIWAVNQGGTNNPPDELIADGVDTFGSGINARTVLINTAGEERATHLQTTTQTKVMFPTHTTTVPVIAK